MFNFKKIAACAAAAMTLACSVTAMPTSAGWGYVYAKGDVNGDGRVTAQDCDAVVDIVMGRKAPSKKSWGAADVNFDDKVDLTDRSIINSYLNSGQFFPDGDLDGDYCVDIYDLTILEDYILRGRRLSALQKKWADVKRDGVIDTADYKRLLKYYNTYS